MEVIPMGSYPSSFVEAEQAKPVSEQLMAKEPIVKEPIVKEPIVKEPIVKEPIAKDLAAIAMNSAKEKDLKDLTAKLAELDSKQPMPSTPEKVPDIFDPVSTNHLSNMIESLGEYSGQLPDGFVKQIQMILNEIYYRTGASTEDVRTQWRSGMDDVDYFPHDLRSNPEISDHLQRIRDDLPPSSEIPVNRRGWGGLSVRRLA